MPEIDILDPIKDKSSVDIALYLRTESKNLKEKYETKIVDVDGRKTYKMSVQEAEEWRAGQDRLGKIGEYYDQISKAELKAAENDKRLADLETKAARPMQFSQADKNGDQQPQFKSPGQLFVESAEYKAACERAGVTKGSSGNWSDAKFAVQMPDFQMKSMLPGVEFKTTMSTGAGFSSPNYRTDVVVPIASRRPVIQNFIPEIPFDMDVVKFMEQTTRTNSSAPASENSALSAGAIAYTEQSQTVEAVGQIIPVTEQQLAVSSAIQELINNDLMVMQQLEEESLILNGTGTTPQILGLYNVSSVQTQAKATDPGPDAVYKLMTKLRGGSGVGFVEPGPQFWNPNDWQLIRLLRDAKGDYIWGNPAEAGPDTIWGKPVIQTVVVTAGSPVTGDFQLYSNIYRRLGITVEAGYNNDDWANLRRTMRCYSRLAMVWKRHAAFGYCTGMNA